jgi:hypothetical protein
MNMRWNDRLRSCDPISAEDRGQAVRGGGEVHRVKPLSHCGIRIVEQVDGLSCEAV